MALWGQALGPVGHAVDTGLATLVGWTRIIIPLVSAGAGVVLLIERERPEPLRTWVRSSGSSDSAGSESWPRAPLPSAIPNPCWPPCAKRAAGWVPSSVIRSALGSVPPAQPYSLWC